MVKSRAALAGTAWALLLWTGCAIPTAWAEGDCVDLALAEVGDVAVLQKVVSPAPRTWFIKNASADARCPSAQPACRLKSYLVPADQVIVMRNEGDFSCASFIAKGGRTTTGWLPTASLEVEMELVPPPEWVGEWILGDEANLSIKLLDEQRLEFSGSASWGGHDPERVARGGVHVGEIEATAVSFDGPALTFEPGVGNTEPGAAGEYSCQLSAQRIGAVLLVRDNFRCGGMNVSFSGVYTRR